MVALASHLSTGLSAGPGRGYDGVVRISHQGSFGTGILLFDGQAVLTAAHVLSDVVGSVDVLFQTASGDRTEKSSDFYIYPGYDKVNQDGDLAIVFLSQPAMASAQRYQLYRDDPVGLDFEMVGFGRTGSGVSGSLTGTGGSTRSIAQNTFDADGAILKMYLGASMSWTPSLGTTLMADFDNGSATNDALGRLMTSVYADLGLGANEGLIAPGDSGGPALIDKRVAGVASYIASLSRGAIEPDINTRLDSSYGEVAGWTSVGAYQAWIDQLIRGHDADAPQKPSEVLKEVSEGQSGVQQAYFMVSLNGLRTDPNAIVSVDYQTHDGTATAGQDYLAVSGRLNLYPDESYALVMVEVLGDQTAESDETFYLELSHPVGAIFEHGLSSLWAMRVILNDDLAV